MTLPINVYEAFELQNSKTNRSSVESLVTVESHFLTPRNMIPPRLRRNMIPEILIISSLNHLSI